VEEELCQQNPPSIVEARVARGSGERNEREGALVRLESCARRRVGRFLGAGGHGPGVLNRAGIETQYRGGAIVLLFVKNLAFTLVVPGTVAVCLPWLIARREAIGPTGHVAGASVLVLLGATIYLWCLWDFACFGRGTPAPIDAPKRLVVRGLYRCIRNPMYVGVLAVIAGWAVLFQSLVILLYAIAVGGAFHSAVVCYEEPHLRRVFGAEYEAYCSSVGRWFPRARESGRR
jgi:protein-S-isoprenylcysteine O-methyltransferase Ste14